MGTAVGCSSGRHRRTFTGHHRTRIAHHITAGTLQSHQLPICAPPTHLTPCTTGMSLDKAASAPPSWLRGGEGQVRLAKAKAAAAATSAHLNPSQQAAVATTLKRTLTLWQGPPGTGKTRTLLRFVEAALACLPPKAQVLATAASNVAVDNMVAGLLELGIRVRHWAAGCWRAEAKLIPLHGDACCQCLGWAGLHMLC